MLGTGVSHRHLAAKFGWSSLGPGKKERNLRPPDDSSLLAREFGPGINPGTFRPIASLGNLDPYMVVVGKHFTFCLLCFSG